MGPRLLLILLFSLALVACGRELPPASPATAAKPEPALAKAPNAEPARPHVPLTAVPTPARIPEPKPPQPFRLATYNINWGNADLPAVVEAIAEANPDILCLQETNTESEQYLHRRLSTRYATLKFRGGAGEFAAERFGFVSRYPLIADTFVPRKDGLFGMWIARFQIGDRTVQVANLHLQPALFAHGMTRLQMLGAIGKMETRHQSEIEHFYPHLAEGLPTLVAGDFNSLSTFAAPRYLAERGFVDAFAQCHQQPDLHPTWHWSLSRWNLRLRLDYVFCNARFRPLDARVIECDASDHFLVVTRLGWAAEP